MRHLLCCYFVDGIIFLIFIFHCLDLLSIVKNLSVSQITATLPSIVRAERIKKFLAQIFLHLIETLGAR